MLVHIVVGITLLIQNVYFTDAKPEIPVFVPEECGTITPDPPSLILNGVQPEKGAVPWHVVIYEKQRNVCAGSLITADKIISAAHCFWSPSERHQLAAEEFSAAVGKLYPDWGDEHDDTAQKSDVKEIHLPLRFAGIENLQDDIALLVVAKPFLLNKHVRPVCLNFDTNLKLLQLKPGNKGKVAGWTVGSDGSEAQSLKAAEMPYVDTDTCVKRAATMPEVRKFITFDKICAGDGQPVNESCRGDGGVGLSFPTTDIGVERYYLRGTASIASSPTETTPGCDTQAYGLFTDVTLHEIFIKQFLS